MKVTLESINTAVREDAEKFILQCEKNYRDKLKSISDEVASHSGRTLVMLAGPSGSGKTTTAAILKKNFEALGRNAISVSLDDFYSENNLNYTFEDGTVDYETVKALDEELIGQCLTKLMNDGVCDLPRFSFKTKKRESFVETKADKDGIIIVEGLHAINPVITENVRTEKLKKLYVSVSSRIYEGDDVLLTKRDMRFVRRLIRDYHHRNTEVEYTFYLWRGVRKGEDRYLFPFSHNADIRIDSIHPYEPCVFRGKALELLSHVKEESVYYEESRLLREKISKFESLSEREIPTDSLLNEFTE